MAIDPKTGLEQIPTNGTNMQGQVDSQTPANAQSLTGGVQINTEAMKKYNPDYNPNVGSGVSGVMGTPVSPVVQPETQSNVPPQPVQPIQAPIVPPEPVTQPTQVEKTTTITPQGETVVKKETPSAPTIDYNTSIGRESEISNNLNTITVGNPDLLTDRNAFNASFGYATADAGKKALLDSFFSTKSAQAMSPETIFNQIATGQPVSDAVKQTPAYKQANTRLENLRQYSSYNPNQFATAISSGQLLPGTQTYNDLLRDPKLKANIEKANTLNQVNGNKLDTNKAVSTVMNDIVDNSPLGKAMKDGFISSEEANQLTTTPEIQAKSDALLKLQNDVTIKQNAYDNIRTDVMNELKGTGATTSQMEALIGSRQRDMLGGLNLSIGLYNNSLGQLSDMKKQQADLFDINMNIYEKRQASEQQLSQEQRQFERQKELAQYQQDLQLKGNQAEFEQKVKQQAQMAQDPYTAISTVMDEYKKLGVPFTQSIQTKMADAENFIAQGGTIGGYVDKMIKDIQAKPEYRSLNAPKPTAQPQVWTKLDDTTLYNQATGETKSIKLGTPISTDEINSFTTTRNGSTNIQCGELVNDYWKKVTGSSARIGNSINDKYGAISNIGRSDKPVVGGLFVSNPLNNNVGHTGIVSKVNDDGSIEVREANAQGKASGQPPITKTYSAKQVSDMRFSKAPQVKAEVSPVQGEAKSWVDAWNKGAMDLETILTKIGSSKESLPLKNEVIRQVSSQGGVAWRQENDPAVTKLQDMIDKLNTASKSNYINTVAGTVQTSLTNFMTQGKNDLLADLKSVIEGGTLQQLIDAKAGGATFGALSNEELKMLQATSSALAGNARRDETGKIIGFDMSESKLKAEISKIKSLLEEKKNRMTGKGIVPQTQTVGQTQSGAGTTQGYTSASGKTYNLNDYR